MQTISVPTTTYQKLLEKARAFDRVLTLTKQSFPLDEYSADDIVQFKKNDLLPQKQKQAILSIIKKSKTGGKV